MTAAHIYVGIRKSDGSVRAMCCDDEGVEEQTAEIVADWIKRGLSVERMPAAEYTQRLANDLAKLNVRVKPETQDAPHQVPKA